MTCLATSRWSFTRCLFYGGLTLIAIGTGCSTNISTMVGSLYSANDPRSDSGFSIFYMGSTSVRCWRANCRYLAQENRSKTFVTMGLTG